MKFFELSRELLCVVGLDGYVKVANPAWRETLGWSTEELSAKPLSDFFHSDDRGRVLAGWKSSFEARFSCKDGSHRWLQWTAAYSPEEKLIQAIARDITAQYYLTTVIEHLPIALFSKDAKDLKFTLWNKTSEKWYGVTKEEAIGKTDYDFFPKEQADFFVSKDRETLASGNTMEIPEEPINTKSNGTRILHTRKIPVKDADGNPLFLLGFSDDITDRKSMEESLKKTQDQLLQSQKLDSIGKLAGGVAHDFNNLLAAILSYGRTLRNELKNDPRSLQRIDAIVVSAERGAELTRQLLGFARQGQYQKKTIELGEVIAEARNVLSRSMDKAIAIHALTEPGLWTIEGDSTQVLQVLINLGVNARDAMPHGGELRIEASNYVPTEQKDLKPGKYIRISVKDNGEGIAKELHHRIFDPFFTTKEVGKGTGLGLSMVYGIMQTHSGAVTLTSEEGKGAEFVLYFPATETPAACKVIDMPRRDPGGSEVDISGQTILVADDEDLLREWVGEFLTDRGATVLFAADGREALEVYRANHERIDAVILDVGMPAVSGIEVYQLMRQLNPGLKAIFSTGYSSRQSELTKLLVGGNAELLEKPFTEESLLRKLAKRPAKAA